MKKTQQTRIPATLVAATVSALVVACTAGDSKAAAQASTSAAVAQPLVVAPLETREANGVRYGYRPAFEGQTRAPGLDSQVQLDVRVVASGLDNPWAVEVLPDGRFLVTERSGSLRIIGADGSKSAPATGLPEVFYKGQGGLLDVALDPQYASNHTIYWSYSEPRQGGNGTALARGVLVEEGDSLAVRDVKVIFRQMPTFESNLHFGSRIVMNPDGTLFLTLGERSLPASRVQAQDLGSHFGKVVRINPDGSVPADNPFTGRSDAKPEIWSYGHRNVQAAALDPATGKLWTIEHGPRGGDELNQPQAGLNYGWPVISYGIDYPGGKMGEGITAREGMQQPVYYWDPVIAPSGMMFYQGDLFPQWKGSLFVGGLGGKKLVRLKLEDDKVVGEEWLLQDRDLRLRDVQQGPDGTIYVVADGADSPLLAVRPAGSTAS